MGSCDATSKSPPSRAVTFPNMFNSKIVKHLHFRQIKASQQLRIWQVLWCFLCELRFNCDDVRIFWEVKIYSIATLVIFCKCQMLEFCKLTELKANVTLMFWMGIHWGLHHSAWRCILQAKLHVWCVHSSKDNWRKCPSLHHKKIPSHFAHNIMKAHLKS